MSKYSNEFKLKVVEYYLNNNPPYLHKKMPVKIRQIPSKISHIYTGMLKRIKQIPAPIHITPIRLNLKNSLFI